MPKYLCKANHTVEGTKGLLKDGGTSRRAAVTKIIEALGGKVGAYYYALGDVDLYFVAEMPDNMTVVASSLIANSPGTAEVNFTPLLTPEEMDESVAMANKMMAAYRPPGA